MILWYIQYCCVFFLPDAAKIGMSMNEELESKQSVLPPNEHGQLAWTRVNLLFVHSALLCKQ